MDKNKTRAPIGIGKRLTGPFKILESEQAVLLKTFDGYFADVKNHWAQKITVSAGKKYQIFFDELKENRERQRFLLQSKFFFENFEN